MLASLVFCTKLTVIMSEFFKSDEKEAKFLCSLRSRFLSIRYYCFEASYSIVRLRTNVVYENHMLLIIQEKKTDIDIKDQKTVEKTGKSTPLRKMSMGMYDQGPTNARLF